MADISSEQPFHERTYSGGFIGRVQMPGYALAGELWMAAQETQLGLLTP
jgi:hypothetical protein